MSQVIEFLGTSYQIGDGVSSADHQLSLLPMKKLAELHNLVNANLGGSRRVKKFSSKAVGVKAASELLLSYQEIEDFENGEGRYKELPDLKPRKRKAKSKKREHSMIFNFKPESEIKATKGSITSLSDDTRTLRQRAVAALLSEKGVSFTAMEKIVEKFDKDRGVPGKCVQRRTYELIRLTHYYLGYGLRQDGDYIFAYTE